ncbi:hypothetical protein G7Y82_03255 [Solimonas sp. C16B3]|uniref:Uncharacterized protein n=2 Tax=Solimonas marina TaxID=2714601 RepID=A0A970B8F1_9GAMM|nr:hypothetical protein [Solimonas marina]NKF21321.1 hypothetical protein [Solimonas marina]
MHQFDAPDCSALLDRLPGHDDRSLRHVVDAGHPLHRDPRLVELLSRRVIVRVVHGHAAPAAADPGAAGFVYGRSNARDESEPEVCTASALDGLVETAAAHAAGGHESICFTAPGLWAPRAAQALLARLPTFRGEL